MPLQQLLMEHIRQSADQGAALMQLLAQDKNNQISVTVDTAGIADAIREGIAGMEPPVVNVPPRPATSYQVTSVEYDRKGDLVGARIHPIETG